MPARQTMKVSGPLYDRNSSSLQNSLTFLAHLDHRRGWRFPTGIRILPCTDDNAHRKLANNGFQFLIGLLYGRHPGYLTFH